jgi:hypothetical protein
VTRDQILAEIKRAAERNGGRPLGMNRFAAETGIREADWKGRHWARWNDAVVEAGFAPNELTARYNDDEIVARLIVEIRRLGRMPTEPELNLLRRADEAFPSVRVFRRWGSKRDRVRRVLAYCADQPEYDDVREYLALSADEQEPDVGADILEPVVHGFVYLLKSGRYYKIGHTNDVGRRRYDLAIQLPEPATEVHVISTDDPVGIERYWHGRFSARRKNGEWFELTRADVAAFKKRRFM